MNVADRIKDGAGTSAAGTAKIMQIGDESTSTPTSDCVGVYCVRSSLMKTHWAVASARFTTTFINNPFGHKCDIRRLRYDGSYGIIGLVINVPVDVDTMVQQLPRELDDDLAFNINIKKNMIHKSTYLSGVVKKSVLKIWLQFLLSQPLYKHYKITVNWDTF
ncbi:unnamed protein product [Hermetia illucens]|uniref:Uncharacterized protein n=1 Tax=Hermetia illucens TaxID=343691 RepID=A0A7R8USR7_HERIL|nr:unnamed protein product [Hermetia illucens]